jgi:hypothetical protein
MALAAEAETLTSAAREALRRILRERGLSEDLRRQAEAEAMPPVTRPRRGPVFWAEAVAAVAMGQIAVGVMAEFMKQLDRRPYLEVTVATIAVYAIGWWCWRAWRRRRA